MPSQTQKFGRRTVARRTRAVLSMERLESRTLLAGLINVGDPLLQAPAIAVESSYADIKTVEVNDKREPDATTCNRDHEKQGDECGEFEMSIDPPGGTQPQVPSEPAPTAEQASAWIVSRQQSYFVTPIATAAFSVDMGVSITPARKSGASASDPPAITPSPFHYFTGPYDTARAQTGSLQSQPLFNDAVQHSYFALLLLEPTKFDQIDVINPPPRESSLPTKTVSVEIARMDPQTRVRDAERAISFADETLREADAMLAYEKSAVEGSVDLVAELNDVVVMKQIGIAIQQPRESKHADRNRFAWLHPAWQFGLFGVMALLISARSFVFKDAETTACKSETADKCSPGKNRLKGVGGNQSQPRRHVSWSQKSKKDGSLKAYHIFFPLDAKSYS